jgi:hypothetical protein
MGSWAKPPDNIRCETDIEKFKKCSKPKNIDPKLLSLILFGVEEWDGK